MRGPWGAIWPRPSIGRCSPSPTRAAGTSRSTSRCSRASPTRRSTTDSRTWSARSTAVRSTSCAPSTCAAATPTASTATDYPKADPDSYFRLADAIEDAAIDAISIEDAHRPNDLSLLERFRGTTVILGVVAIAKSRIEDTGEIAERLGAALGHIDAHRLVAAPDCGLGLLGRDLARSKLANLCSAARGMGGDRNRDFAQRSDK